MMTTASPYLARSPRAHGTATHPHWQGGGGDRGEPGHRPRPGQAAPAQARQHGGGHHAGAQDRAAPAGPASAGRAQPAHHTAGHDVRSQRQTLGAPAARPGSGPIIAFTHTHTHTHTHRPSSHANKKMRGYNLIKSEI